MIKLTVVWASAEDRVSNDAFNIERTKKLIDMVSKGKASKKLNVIPKISPVGEVVFNDLNSAIEWEVFIKDLANKYNKTIISISREEI